MALFSIDEKLCAREGLCAGVCQFQLIDWEKPGSLPRPAPGRENECMECGHCLSVCPTGAFKLEKMANCPRIEPALTSTPEQAEQLVRSRRSIRAYQTKPVERATLERAIEIAHYAPTASNSQQVVWSVLNSHESIKKLSSMTIDFFKSVEKGPDSENSRRVGRLVAAWEKGVDTIARGAPTLVFVSAPKDYLFGCVDCTIALTSFDLIAPSLGLGTCWAGLIMVALSQWAPLQNAIAELIPEGNHCQGIMMVGYPKNRYSRMPMRKTLKLTWNE